MLRYTERDGAITFGVRVVARASRSGVAGEADGHLRVRVAAPPVEGAANAELVLTIARWLGVPRSAVEITAGLRSKSKQVRVRGADVARLEGLLRG
jgi:uncharacterized protein (TIGR00251 family)